MDSNVVIEKLTSKIVCESFEKNLALRINLEKYEVMPRSAYEQNLGEVQNEDNTK